ncbi:MAG: hypothetical protein ABH871_05015 [Pseudomonadota bacterium]
MSHFAIQGSYSPLVASGFGAALAGLPIGIGQGADSFVSGYTGLSGLEGIGPGFRTSTFWEEKPIVSKKPKVHPRRVLLQGALGILGGFAAAACAKTARIVPAQEPVIVQEPEPIPALVEKAHTQRGKAIILNGDQLEPNHIRNVIRAYKFFLGIGYGREDIFVLSAPYEAFLKKDSKALAEVAEEFEFTIPQISGPATKRNFKKLLEQIYASMSGQAELFLYITGHGGNEKGRSVAQLNAPGVGFNFDKLGDHELRDMLEHGPFGHAVVLFDGCHGEGFARNVGGGRITAITKTAQEEEYYCGHFAEIFFNSPWRNDADANEDGVIKLHEAARYTNEYVEDHGVESSLTIVGDYNPPLKHTLEKGEYVNGAERTFYEFFPGKGSFRVYQVPDIPLDRLLEKGVVTLVRDQKAARAALSDPNCIIYFHSNSYEKRCPFCEYTDGFLLQLAQEMGAHENIYVFEAQYEGEGVNRKLASWMKDVMKRFNVNGYPAFVRFKNGEVVDRLDRPPTKQHHYGDLPDNNITIFDTKELARFIR